MSVGTRIKEARERMGLSRNELSSLLNITVSAISNYENDISSPRCDILFNLMNTLECDANFIFQDCINVKTYSLTPTERALIREFRQLEKTDQDQILKQVSSLNIAKKVAQDGEGKVS